jgi:DNA invertase Pin-like site-specific DNA recombinase
MKPKRVALYARVSTNKHKCRACHTVFSEDDDTESPCPACGSTDIERGQRAKGQLLELREYAVARGWEMTREYVDRGVSGTKDSRPQLDELMADARRRKFDAVLVWRFDRFARSTKHLISALEEFQTVGVDFISLKEAIDTSTPMGKMVFTILGAVAELERSLIVERIHMGLARARKEGKHLGRPAHGRADVQEILALKESGLSQAKVAKKLGLTPAYVSRAVKRYKTSLQHLVKQLDEA